ncbi:TolC family protein [Clostridium sp. CTA-5]
MRKNLNKIVSLTIGISVLSGSIVPVFATDITHSTYVNNMQKPVLTLDDVIKATINNSDKLALKQKELHMYDDKEDVQDKKDDFYDENNLKTGNDTIDDFLYDKLGLQQKQTEQSKSFLKDQIANDITKKYNNIILKQIDINKLKTSLEIKTNDFNNLQTKVSIGMATANQLEDKQIEIKSLQNDIQSKENSLKNNIDYLGVLTNLNLSNYTLDSSIDYNIFKIDGSIDEYLDDKIDTYFKYNNEMIDLTKDYLKELKSEDIKDIIDEDIPSIPDKSLYIKTDETGISTLDSGSYALALIGYQQKVESFTKRLTAYESYLDAKYSMDEAKVKLDDSKKSLKNGLKESYSTLLDLENKINRLKEQISSTNTKLKYAKAQVDMGMMTENDYKAEILKSQNLDTSLRNLINTYNNLENSIEKPWILSSN